MYTKSKNRLVASSSAHFSRRAAVRGLGGTAGAAGTASSLGCLGRTLSARTQLHGGGPTLEDIVRAELRPMLKEWLDTQLPPLVERLVRVEIERVVGRADT